MTDQSPRWAPRRIDRFSDPVCLFSVCTLVTDGSLYREMCESFREGGFDGEDVEFLYVDNTSGNMFDAYAGLNCLISHACGEYLILCHQDVVLMEDGRSALLARLGELQTLDPAWGLAGNAGGLNHERTAVRITDLNGVEHTSGTFPRRAVSLDENFIVMKSACRLGFSRDLQGFHLYGTDICLQAEAKGWSAYVIDFHLRHNGHGQMGRDFDRCKANLEEKYGRYMRMRTLRTTCTSVVLSAGGFQRRTSNFWHGIRVRRRTIWKRIRGKRVA
jgi:hypothetical protein